MGVTTVYLYNADNRLIEVQTPTDTCVYRYDGFGNRIGTTQNGEITEYVIDPLGLGNVAAELRDGSLVAKYDHGYGLVGRTSAVGDPAFYTFQAIGHTSEVTDSTGTILNWCAYDPFGGVVAHSMSVHNAFQFVGEYGVMKEVHGPDFMRARYYDAKLGRFVHEDPLGIDGGDTNVVRYVQNAPSNVRPIRVLSG